MNLTYQSLFMIQLQGEEKASSEDSNASSGTIDLSSSLRRDFPLFTVDLIIKDDKVVYTTPPDSFMQTPLTLLDKALVQLQEIPQLERDVMPHLFSKKGAFLLFS